MQQAKHENRDDPGAFNEEMHRRIEESKVRREQFHREQQMQDAGRPSRETQRPAAIHKLKDLDPAKVEKLALRDGLASMHTLAKSKSLVSGDPIFAGTQFEGCPPCSLTQRLVKHAKLGGATDLPWARSRRLPEADFASCAADLFGFNFGMSLLARDPFACDNDLLDTPSLLP